MLFYLLHIIFKIIFNPRTKKNVKMYSVCQNHYTAVTSDGQKHIHGDQRLRRLFGIFAFHAASDVRTTAADGSLLLMKTTK
jgi:hypothetical protein